MDPALIGGGLRLLGGLFGRKKAPTPSQNIMSQAKGARQAAEKYGFNPLTMLQYGQPGGAMGGGGDAPPLASLSILGEMIEENYGQDAKDRREHNRLTNELLTLEVQNARSLSGVAPPSAVAGMRGGPPAFNGGRAAVITASPIAHHFLDETDRNPAVPDERDNTVSYQSHGQESVVPIGPDFDEILTGMLIDANNRAKAAKARMAMGPMDTGTPLSVPMRGIAAGLGGTVFVPDPSAVMPPKSKRLPPLVPYWTHPQTGFSGKPRRYN